MLPGVNLALGPWLATNLGARKVVGPGMSGCWLCQGVLVRAARGERVSAMQGSEQGSSAAKRGLRLCWRRASGWNDVKCQIEFQLISPASVVHIMCHLPSHLGFPTTRHSLWAILSFRFFPRSWNTVIRARALLGDVCMGGAQVPCGSGGGRGMQVCVCMGQVVGRLIWLSGS